jgi:glycine oxidase
VRGVTLADGARIDADAVVVCAGAWTSLVPDVGLTDGDVFPVRGQMIEIDATSLPESARPQRVVFVAADDAHAYVIPRRNGRMVCGSTMERAGFAKDTTEAGLARVHAGAVRAVPELAGLPVVSSWAGLRPGTRDGLPLLGAGAAPGLFVSTGHFRNGVLLAAISAELIGAMVAGEAAPIDATPFAPLRFAPVVPT